MKKRFHMLGIALTFSYKAWEDDILGLVGKLKLIHDEARQHDLPEFIIFLIFFITTPIRIFELFASVLEVVIRTIIYTVQVIVTGNMYVFDHREKRMKTIKWKGDDEK